MSFNHTQEKQDADNLKIQHLRLVATYASCSVAFLLIAVKLYAYFETDSVSMLSSLLDSTVDLLASLVTMLGVKSALRPPDDDHRFGHGKAESLAALGQATFITGSSVLLCFEALKRFYTPAVIQEASLGYAVMAFAIIMTILLISFQRYTIRKTGSMAISADSLHYTGDVAVNIAVMLSLFAQAETKATWIDPVFALAIGAGLMVSAWKIGRQALDVLMDKELPEDKREQIIRSVLALTSVEGVHDVRTRTDGERVFVEIHVEVDPKLPLVKAHDVAEEAMEVIKKDFPVSDILVHLDPIGHDEERLDEIIEGRRG